MYPMPHAGSRAKRSFRQRASRLSMRHAGDKSTIQDSIVAMALGCMEPRSRPLNSQSVAADFPTVRLPRRIRGAYPETSENRIYRQEASGFSDRPLGCHREPLTESSFGIAKDQTNAKARSWTMIPPAFHYGDDTAGVVRKAIKSRSSTSVI
jgi:hypothetical protein